MVKAILSTLLRVMLIGWDDWNANGMQLFSSVTMPVMISKWPVVSATWPSS